MDNQSPVGGRRDTVNFPFFCVVQQETAAVIQKFGKFDRIAEPGLVFKLPFLERVAEEISQERRASARLGIS
jgi:regulator of protease activity HflC (stomatin/prohibitin superfamily)